MINLHILLVISGINGLQTYIGCTGPSLNMGDACWFHRAYGLGPTYDQHALGWFSAIYQPTGLFLGSFSGPLVKQARLFVHSY